MPDISNQIASFGRGAGSGIIQGLNRAENRRRYDEQTGLQRNAFAAQQQERDLRRNEVRQQREIQAQQQMDADERDHFSGGVQAILSAPAEQRPLVYQGVMQEAANRGFDVQGAPEYSDDVISKMAGSFGITVPKPQTVAPTNLGKLMTERDTLATDDPRRAPYDAAIKKLTSPSAPLVSIGGKVENKELIELAKVRAKQYGKLSDAAENAQSTLAALDQLDAIDATTGALEPAKAAFAAVIQGFGINASGIANVTTAQALEAVSNRLVNEVLNAAKGPQTEGDALRAQSTIKSLGDDPRAAQFKSDSLRAISLRTVEMADFIDVMIDEGSTYSKAKAAWNKYKKNNPSLSGVIKNPSTGLPLFFYQFKQHAKTRREGITDAEIVEAWRKANG